MVAATRKNAKLDQDQDGQMKLATDTKQEDKGEKKEEQNGDSNGSNEKKRSNAPSQEKSKEDEPPSKAVKTDDVEKEPIENPALHPGKEDDSGQEEGQYKVLEQGILYFFYRPKVQAADDVENSGKAATSIDDVQNTHVLLVPTKSESEDAPPTNKHENGSDQNENHSATTGEKAKKEGVGFRLIRLGKKRLPAPEEAIKKGLQPGGIGGDSSEAIWSVVSDIGSDVSELSGDLGEKRYNTRTRGERYVGGSRPAGRGRYAIVFHELQPPSRSNVRLTYALSHPTEIGDVQTELGIALSGSVRLSMRNPTLPQTGQGAPPAGLPEEERVEMSKDELNEAFGGKTDEGGTRYTDPDQIEWLNREGVELLMNRERNQSKDKGAHTGASEEQAKALEHVAQKEGKGIKMVDVLNELHLSSKQNPPDAIEGTWI